MKCSTCGTENPEYAVYCLQCGAQIQSGPVYQKPDTAPETSQPPPPQPAYQQPPISSAHPLPKGNGVLILIFGILGLFFCMPLGFVAWLMANSDLQKMHTGLISRSEEGITQAGKILGIIAVALFVLAIAFLIVVIGFGTHFGGENIFDM